MDRNATALAQANDAFNHAARVLKRQLAEVRRSLQELRQAQAAMNGIEVVTLKGQEATDVRSENQDQAAV